jgi:hypothetical protein
LPAIEPEAEMTHKPMSREDIELRLRALFSGEHLEFAQQATVKLTPRDVRIFKSIKGAGASAIKLPDEVRQLFEKISEACGVKTAVDLFERTIEDLPKIWRNKEADTC